MCSQSFFLEHRNYLLLASHSVENFPMLDLRFLLLSSQEIVRMPLMQNHSCICGLRDRYVHVYNKLPDNGSLQSLKGQRRVPLSQFLCERHFRRNCQGSNWQQIRPTPDRIARPAQCLQTTPRGQNRLRARHPRWLDTF